MQTVHLEEELGMVFAQNAEFSSGQTEGDILTKGKTNS